MYIAITLFNSHDQIFNFFPICSPSNPHRNTIPGVYNVLPVLDAVLAWLCFPAWTDHLDSDHSHQVRAA